MTRGQKYVPAYPLTYDARGTRGAVGQKIVGFRRFAVRHTINGTSRRDSFIEAIALEDGRLLIIEAFSMADPSLPIDALFKLELVPAELWDD